MAWKHGAGVILTGVVKAVTGKDFVLYTQGVDNDGNTYPREFPILGSDLAEAPAVGDWASIKADLVFENRKTQVRATGIKPAKDGTYENLARVLGVARSGFRYFERIGSQQACSFGLVTTNDGPAYRVTLFDNPANLARSFQKAIPGSTVIAQGRLQYGKPFTRDDGREDKILEVVGLDPVWTKVLETPKIVDAFMAWDGSSAPAKDPVPSKDQTPAPAPAPKDDIPF